MANRQPPQALAGRGTGTLAGGVAECGANLMANYPKTCRCGHDRSHPLVHPEPKYSLWGWFIQLVGATATPLRATFVCSRCNQVLGVTTDPKVLREFS
jgi:hypothetical protein